MSASAVTEGAVLDPKRLPTKIDVRGLTKRYGARTVVDNVSVDVHVGEVVGLLGPNGAGKTTTFYMVVGLVKPNGGSVILVDEEGRETDITHEPMHLRAREGLGYLAQETSVFRRLSVSDNLRLIWEQRGVARDEQDRRIGPLLDEFGLTSLSNDRAETLSGGERRRVEIARAIATDPAFLLLDEPFTGIDPIAVADIQEIIRLLKAKGLGVLITDHSVRETLAIVDRAYILNRGRIEVAGTANEVAESPIARKFYLGESFRL
jgi:lipopolysaccharide export system ATP-binding protein